MMTNLFSMFDPSLSSFGISWFGSLLILVFLYKTSPFLIKAKSSLLAELLLAPMKKEVSSLMGDSNKMSSPTILTSLMFVLLLLNLMALLPFNFTLTAHISVSFSLALIFWSGLMIFGWARNAKHMLIHMVPTGTPNQLMNFMVLIELVSNVIRPITLSVRLSANMVAGHLLMSLLANFCMMSLGNLSMSWALLVLTSLEVAVGLIQAYVFMTLITLYSTEVL